MNHARGRRSAWPGDGIVDDHDLAAGAFSVLIPGKYYPPIRSWATVAGRKVRYERPVFTVLLFALMMFGLLVTAVDPTGIASRSGRAIGIQGLSALNLALLVIGAAMIISGIVIRIVAMAALGRNFSGALRIRNGHTLVKTGIYRMIRHPAYLGAILLFVGIPVMLSSIFGFLAMLFFVAFLLFRIGLEEKMLIERFGAEYREYMRRTKRLVPFVY